jgi:hypothetical protein
MWLVPAQETLKNKKAKETNDVKEFTNLLIMPEMVWGLEN